MIKGLWWLARNGVFYLLHRTSERLAVFGNVNRDVRKIKNVEVSGDQLAPYRKEWAKNWGPYLKGASK